MQVSSVNEPQLWSLEFSASQKLTESRTTRYPYGTYLKSLKENLTEKKGIIHFFVETNRRQREGY